MTDISGKCGLRSDRTETVGEMGGSRHSGQTEERNCSSLHSLVSLQAQDWTRRTRKKEEEEEAIRTVQFNQERCLKRRQRLQLRLNSCASTINRRELFEYHQ